MERGAAHEITGIEQPTAEERARHRSRRRSVARAGIPALLYAARRRPVRRGHLGAAIGRHRQRARRSGVRAARRRNPFVLVAAGDQHRRLEIFPRADRHARARAQRQAADRPRRDTITEWARKDGYFASEADLAELQRRAEAHPRVSEGRVQQPRLVQLRIRESAAVLGVLHQFRSGHDGFDPDAGAHRGDALQVRIGHRVEPVGDPLVERSARGRRHRVGSRLVHEGVRRIRRRHQVGRQDAPRGEDGHPQRRPSGHRRVHQLQGRGREEGVGADRRRLRRLVHRPGIRVGVLPELEQQRARDRRVHARGARRWELVDEGGARRRR